MILPPDLLKSYNTSRRNTDKSLACHAPFQNLNFEQNGNGRACCYNTMHILGKWPEQTIKQIWEGQKANELRGYIRKKDFGGGCIECGRMIEAGNYQGVRAKYYDEFGSGISSRINNFRNKLFGNIHYPRVIEFELSNQCNLECVMCNGYFSSSIRKNREKLPAIPSPYNEKFVDQLEEFIPHLTDAKFLGGEPFMIDIYLLIWERILKINPNIRIHITTNGTFLNNRIKELLEGLRAGIIVSMDSVVKETYQQIRVNGNYEKVMENLEYFMDYSKRKNTFISIAACPIIYNWKELPGMLNFCIERNIALYFNAVFTPVELSLREQPVALLQEVISFLEAHTLKESGSPNSPRNLSIRAYNDFIKLLRGWLAEREALLNKKEQRLQQIEPVFNTTKAEESLGWSADEISKTLFELLHHERKGFFEEQKRLQGELAELMIATPPGRLAESLHCFIAIAEDYTGKQLNAEQDEKISLIANMIEQHPYRSEILRQTAQAPPLYFATLLKQKDLQELKGDLLTFFTVQG
jgi:MoaA/NifB/PqqE/SkfB family radical SAM enzyme